MKEEKVTLTVYTCEYCGAKSSIFEEMQYHESICPSNPTNQPCSTCSNCLVDPLINNAFCARGMDMNNVGGKILCFCYVEGQPQLVRGEENDNV